MPRSIIIDCDPGVDDAIALLLAIAQPSALNILGITTVAGNVPLNYTSQNALKICALTKVDIPIYAGCPRPILRPLSTAAHVHGATGLQGTKLPEPKATLMVQHAVAFLIDTLQQATEPITLATLGPLTNIAVALIQAPQITQKIDHIIAMGGAITHGNVTPAAEFNIYVDPHAAQIVFGAGIPIKLITLDTTHQVLTTSKHLDAFRQLNTPVGIAAADLLSHYGTSDIERYGMPGAPLHDPCVIAHLLQPELFTFRPTYTTVDTISPENLGRTVIDWWGQTDKTPNVEVAASVNTPGIYELLIESLGTL
ncbi:inosine-uridine nucleoside n-ribohydrolase [Leptolyngbya sp. Heron Island J]|uniref:nucleoside hydrolase n=1 Tax=Leptolyngbya sp. Heron Island J TaxID=1385935 RepID=UPI0003B9511E|nr:nucleoside hydrolase [Leptolyngbya sp. Heron Island J]ESA34703.1 inosine-uridine nucleoside n-ribohydrolase [Leptolyngbya sp. Heron Island J]